MEFQSSPSFWYLLLPLDFIGLSNTRHCPGVILWSYPCPPTYSDLVFLKHAHFLTSLSSWSFSYPGSECAQGQEFWHSLIQFYSPDSNWHRPWVIEALDVNWFKYPDSEGPAGWSPCPLLQPQTDLAVFSGSSLASFLFLSLSFIYIQAIWSSFQLLTFLLGLFLFIIRSKLIKAE